MPANSHGGRRPGAGRKRASGESYEAARRRKESALADLREAEVARRRGESLDANCVEQEWSGILRMVRAGVLAVVSRARSRLPNLTAHDARIIEEELRTALQTLAADSDYVQDRAQ